MQDFIDANASNHDDGNNGNACNSVAEYLRRATAAVHEGDATLGMHLYLAAFEEAALEGDRPSEDALSGIKKAWALACTNKERSLAEYIFERMEPYLTPDEASVCAGELQDLALDKLEEYGLSRDDLEDMAQAIAEDFLGLDGFEGLDAHVVKVDHLSTRALPSRGQRAGAQEKGAEGRAAAPRSQKAKGDSGQAAGEQGDGEQAELLAEAEGAADIKLAFAEEGLNYGNLAGYDDTIQIMRDLGVGMQDDPDFKKLVGLLNARHGLDRMPALDTMLFRSPAREDANRFAAATLGELALPALHMHMEESLQGMPVLCVTAQANPEIKMSSLRDAFVGGGVLLLEDVDLWASPVAEAAEDMASNFIMAQLTRGAREAVNLIRWAVDNPDVYVLATASTETEIDPFFLDLLEPLSFVDIDFPTPEERIDVWMDIAREHPSIRGINRADLVRLSANMPRFDMYMAAREALEEAYKMGLVTRRYQPVTRENLFDKLAAYQPLDSREYHELEEAVVRDFRFDLTHIDDLLRDE